MNKVILVGNLGKDPESRVTGNGTTVCKFSIATTEVWYKDREKQERTDWHNIVTFGRQAETCAQYLAKGRKVLIEGKLQHDKYEKDGQTRYFTQVKADKIEFLGGRGENNNGGISNEWDQSQNPSGQPAPDPTDDVPSEWDNDQTPF